MKAAEEKVLADKVSRIANLLAEQSAPDSQLPEEFVADWFPEDRDAELILFTLRFVRQQPFAVKTLRRVAETAAAGADGKS